MESRKSRKNNKESRKYRKDNLKTRNTMKENVQKVENREKIIQRQWKIKPNVEEKNGRQWVQWSMRGTDR